MIVASEFNRFIVAAPYKRREQRTGWRYGYKSRRCRPTRMMVPSIERQGLMRARPDRIFLLAAAAAIVGISLAACSDTTTGPMHERVLNPSAFVDDSSCYTFGDGHPCTSDPSGATIQSLTDEANRLLHLSDVTCRSLGLNIQLVAGLGNQGVRVWAATWFPNGDSPAEGDWHSSLPNQIHLWGNLGGSELLRTARHEAVHRMNGGGPDLGSGDPPGYSPVNPSTAMGPGGNPDTMGAYALSDYCGAAT